jgi:ABC-type Mn2+/Zn2+ transport system ATPase subunit
VSRSWSGENGTGKSTLVQNWRGYLDAPQRYLRHILN